MLSRPSSLRRPLIRTVRKMGFMASKASRSGASEGSRSVSKKWEPSTYWKDKRYDAFRQSSGTTTNFENVTVPAAIYAIGDAGFPIAEELAKKAIAESPPGKKREWAEWRLDPKKVIAHGESVQRASRES